MSVETDLEQTGMMLDEGSVGAFIDRFEANQVSRLEWTHQAHLIAGYWYTRLLGADAALEELRTRIRRHNESVGTPNTDQNGYHETITRLYVVAIARHIAQTAEDSFESSLQKLLSSPLAESRWPLRFYSGQRLFSVQARREWLEPDKG